MDTLREYQMTNNHLDHQLSRLKQCKEELLDLFDNLNELETSLPSNGSICTYEVHHTPIYYRDTSSSSSSSSSSSDESELYYKSRYNHDHVPPKPKTKPIMRFSYKIPVNYAADSARSMSQSVDVQSLMSLAEQINSKRANRAKNNQESEEFYDESEYRQRRPPIAPSNPFKSHQSAQAKRPIGHAVQVRPEWSGKRPQTSSSSSFNSSSFRNSPNQMRNRSRSMSIDATAKKSNMKLNKPWKHVGKTKPDPALFLSSQDLSRSSQDIKTQQSIELSSGELKPRAVRKPLRRPMTRSLSNLSDYKPPEALNRKSLMQRQKEIEKPAKKQLVDEKDVGKGWKPTTKTNVKELDFKIYAPPPTAASASQDLTKDGQKSLKKSLVDEKDVGKGWKPAGKKDSLNDVYKSANVEKLPVESANVTPSDKKSKLSDSKDVGKGWKPAGVASKPPKPITTGKSSEQDPLMKTTRLKPSSINKLKKNSIESKSSLNNKNKQSIEDMSINRMATSTPDFDQKAADGFKDELDESIIEKEMSGASVPKRKSSKENSSPNLNRSPNDSRNKNENQQEALNENIKLDENKKSEEKESVSAPSVEQKEKAKNNWDDDEDIEDSEAGVETNKQPDTEIAKEENPGEIKELESNKQNNEGESKKLDDTANDEETEEKSKEENAKKDDETPATTNREPTEEELDEQERQFWNMKDDDDDDDDD